VDVALRNAIDSGIVNGPRLRVSGQGLTITGGHMDSPMWAPEVSISGRTGVCDGPWGCRQAAREQIKRGVDLIKVNAAVSRYSTDYTHTEPFHQEMTYEEMAAICEEAHWAGMTVAAHAHGGEGITDGLRAGLDSIEHAPWLTDEQIDMMAENGVFYVPTLTVHTFLKELGQETIGMPDGAWNWLLRVCDDRWDTLERAKKAGVKIATGTDAGFFVEHGDNAFELEDLVRGGFSPMEAIQAATGLAAECMNMNQEIGTIEAGKYADLVVVDGDPLSDISILRDADRIVQVYKGGVTVK
jgi:imidazolonepropionase-like amidohydrolase